MKKLKGAPQLGLSHFPSLFSIAKLTDGSGKEKNFIHYPVKSSETRMNIGVQRFSIVIFHGGN